MKAGRILPRVEVRNMLKQTYGYTLGAEEGYSLSQGWSTVPCLLLSVLCEGLFFTCGHPMTIHAKEVVESGGEWDVTVFGDDPASMWADLLVARIESGQLRPWGPETTGEEVVPQD